jgi:hypothetical protein
MDESCTILWFRKEKEFNRKWVEKPVRRIGMNLPNEIFTHEEHPYLDIWIQKNSRNFGALGRR